LVGRTLAVTQMLTQNKNHCSIAGYSQPIDFSHLLSTLDSSSSQFIYSHIQPALKASTHFIFQTSETLTSPFSLTSFFSFTETLTWPPHLALVFFLLMSYLNNPFYFLHFSLILSLLTSSISIAEEQPCPYMGLFPTNRLNMRRSVMKNSLVWIGDAEVEWVK
jgi:hypothetical protein